MVDYTISSTLRNAVKDRDDNKCIKCGRFSKLEVHHIIPRYLGGKDIEHNLITLCRNCHKNAPDDPIEFFKWASSHLPVELEQSKLITKSLLGIISYKKDKYQSLISNDTKTQEEFYKWVDSFYFDLWKVFVSNDMIELGKFMVNHLSNSDKNNIEIENSTKEKEEDSLK